MSDYRDQEMERLEAEVEAARQDQRRSYTTLPEDQARELFTKWVIEAETRGGFARCLMGEAVVALPYGHALGPGHIYSEAGEREYKITRICEYHFDEWTAEPEDDDAEGS